MSLKKPRICIVNDDHYPSRWTNTQQTMKTAAALAATGHAQIEVILPRRWGVMFDSHHHRLREIQTFYGVDGHFELTQIPSVPLSVLRVEKLSHGLLAPLYSVIAGHDVVYSRNVLPLAIALAAGKRVVFESHRVLRQHYPVTYHAIRGLMQHPHFLGVVTNAAMIANSFVDMGLPRERVINAHNCYDPADMQDKLTKSDARAKIGMAADDRIVCYAGHIQKRKGIEMIVAMAAKTPELRYLICGGGPSDVAQAKRFGREARANNMTFTGWIDVRQLAPYLYASDVLLIPPTSAPLQRHGNTVMPIKTYTYMAAGGAIVAPRQEDVFEVLRDGENCLLVTPDNLGEAVAAVRRIFADREFAARLGTRAEQDATLYTWKTRAHAILDFIKQRLAATTP